MESLLGRGGDSVRSLYASCSWYTDAITTSRCIDAALEHRDWMAAAVCNLVLRAQATGECLRTRAASGTVPSARSILPHSW